MDGWPTLAPCPTRLSVAMDEMFIGSMVDRELNSGPLSVTRAPARARRRPPRRCVKTPEYRALDEIVADARTNGHIPLAIGPAGIVEVQAFDNVAVDADFTPCRIKVGPDSEIRDSSVN